MNKKRKIIVIIVAVVAVLFIGYNYIMYGGARDLQSEKPEFTTTATSIFEEFSTNSDSATKKYINKAVEISGEVTAVKDSTITLNEKVNCQLQTLSNAKIGEKVTIKGRVTGYDDLLEELKLDQCVNNKE